MNAMAPWYSVATQLKTLMAVKTPTNIESDAEHAGVERSTGPTTNMWWPQVKKPTNAMPSDE